MASTDFLDFDPSPYMSSGSSIATPAQNDYIAQSDNSFLDGLLKVVNTGVGAYATVQAAKAPKAAQPQGPSEPPKAAAPVVGTPATAPASGVMGNMKNPVVWIVGGVVALVLIVGVFFRRK